MTHETPEHAAENFIVHETALCLRKSQIDFYYSDSIIAPLEPMWERMPPPWVFAAIFSGLVKTCSVGSSPFVHLAVCYGEDKVITCAPGDWLVQYDDGSVGVRHAAKGVSQ